MAPQLLKNFLSSFSVAVRGSWPTKTVLWGSVWLELEVEGTLAAALDFCSVFLSLEADFPFDLLFFPSSLSSSSSSLSSSELSASESCSSSSSSPSSDSSSSSSPLLLSPPPSLLSSSSSSYSSSSVLRRLRGGSPLLSYSSSSSSFSSSSSPSSSSSSSSSSSYLRLLFEWGGAFNSGATSNGYFPEFKCNYEGKQICCSSLENVDKKPKQRHLKHCQIKKEYYSSPYELKQIEKAEELSKITDQHQRTVAFIEFIESKEQMDHAIKWLERITLRQPGKHVKENDDDLEYLSRFKVTRHCVGEPEKTWWEYIEPITVHARHPFGLHACWHPHHRDKIQIYNGNSPKVSLLSVDHILLQSLGDLHGLPNNSSLRLPHPVHPSPTTYILDAGTSRYDTSMYWFVCAYEQLGFLIDNLFGWEYTLLEPIDFWRYVPPKYTGIYRFFNAPISADVNEIHSPLRLIKQLAIPEDFVSFKLDIDTPSVEIPIALEILKSPEMHQLLDEFFFELHFQCEVLMDCGWGYGIPDNFQGQKLDRASALKLFRDFRQAGIRAHFWP